MPGPQLTWIQRLKRALENCNHADSWGGDAAFAALVSLMLEPDGPRVDFLAKLVGFTHDEEKFWIRGWAHGAVVPTKKLRREVMRGITAHFADALRGV